MLSRSSGYLSLRSGRASAAAEGLQSDGYVVVERVFEGEELSALRIDVERVFAEYPPDERGDPTKESAPFRHEMLNRSALVQQAIGNPRILEVIEPLLGEDCHVIANTAWRQEPGDNRHLGRYWHIDSGPHVPRDPSVPWDPKIPYPVFAIAAHLYLKDCPAEAGPTGVIPGSHMSGQAPPLEQAADEDLRWAGQGAMPVLADAGDVAFFVSDIWHRRLPPRPGDPGRMFVQCHYGRRDLAQRIRPAAVANQLSEDAVSRAGTERERTLVGLHPLGFYDS